MTNRITVSVIAIALLVIAGLLAYIAATPRQALGSAIEGQEYLATSTAAVNVYGANIQASALIKTGRGGLAQVVITGANTGTMHFYNATTSDITKRASSKATSTILLASFPASTAAGTYTFDVAFTDGLYLDVSGTVATSTITYR